MTQQKRIGSALRGMRVQRGYTLEDISDQWELPIHTLREIEDGDIDRQFMVVCAYAVALDADLESLFEPVQRLTWRAVKKMRYAAR